MSKKRSLLFYFPWFALLVSIGILHASPAITFNPTSASLAYVKPTGSNSTASTTVAFIGTGNQYAVDSNSVPVWLTVSPMSGQAAATTGTTVTFAASSLCATLGDGLYSGTVKVVNVADSTVLTVPVSIVISEAAPTLSIREGAAGSVLVKSLSVNLAPTFTITLISSGAPVSFAIPAVTDEAVSANANVQSTSTWMKFTPASGIAYSWGTPVTVNIDPTAWAQASVNGHYTGTLVINYGPVATGAHLSIAVDITATAPSPVINGFTPTALPFVPGGGSGSGSFVITGTNFVGSSAVSMVTVATTPYTLVSSDFTTTFQNSGAILVQILGAGAGVTGGKLASSAPGLTGLSVTVTNGSITSTKVLPFTSAPAISSITSASAFIQAAAGGHPTIAPYDVISIFGANLCPTCTGSTGTLGLPSPALQTNPVLAARYPLGLTTTGAAYVQVFFVAHTGGALIGQGNLLFATNNQINVLVPAAVGGSTLLGTNSDGTGKIDVYVDYGGGLATTPATTYIPGTGANATPFNVIAAAVDPGIFTVDSTGQGQGAILNANGSLNSGSSGNGSAAAKGSIVSIFMTGLGIPDSTATDAATTTALAYPTSCLAATAPATPGTASAAPGSYLAAVNTTLTAVSGGTTLYAPPAGTGTYNSPAWTTIDGSLIQSAFVPDLAHHFAPCLKTAPTVTIGGKAATVSYAGWVYDSVVGLYQINAAIPSTATSASDNPVVVTVGGVNSQAGVTVYVQ